MDQTENLFFFTSFPLTETVQKCLRDFFNYDSKENALVRANLVVFDNQSNESSNPVLCSLFFNTSW